jgi:molecular chaperone GrpE
LKTLVDLADALGLARREVVRGREALLASLEPLSALPDTLEKTPRPPAPEPPLSLWQRWFGARPKSVEPAARAEAEPPPAPEWQVAAERAERLLDSLVTGYMMSLQRVERALQEHGLESVPCVGQPFDPERMEVVEVIVDSDQPAGHVVEEVRRGYLWRGRVFRYAQVAVAKP